MVNDKWRPVLWHLWPAAIIQAMTFASGAVLLLAACHDIAARTVPNWMSLLIAAFGIPVAYMQYRLPISLGLGLTVFAAAAVCWRRGWMGGADVKLLGAVSIVLPPAILATFAVAMSIAGAAHAIVYLCARRVVPVPRRPRPRGFLARVFRAEQWRISRGGPLPYACAIAAGLLFVLINGSVP